MMRLLQVSLLLCSIFVVNTAVAQADDKAVTLLRRAEHLLRQVHTLQAEVIDVDDSGSPPSLLRLSKPDSLALINTDRNGNKSLLIGNSKRLLNYDIKERQGSTASLEDLFVLGNSISQIFFITGFLEPGLYRLLEQPTYTGPRTRMGRKYETVRCPAFGDRSAWTLYFAPSGLLEGIEAEAAHTSHSTVPATRIWLRNIHLNIPLSPTTFDFAPPKEAMITELDDPALQLPPVGSPAPDFTMPLLGGGSVTRDGLLKGKKALLLTISFYECGACVQEIPALKRLYSDLKDQGLALLDVNILNNQEDAQKVVDKYHIPYPLGLDDPKGGGKGEIVARYHADAGGLNILIGANGQILWRASGLDEKRLRCVLDHAGLPSLTPSTQP